MTRKQRQKKKKRPLLYLSLFLLLLIVAIYGFGANYYQSHFFPNTTVNTVAIGNADLNKANTKLQKNVSTTLFSLTDNKAPYKDITLTDLGKTTDFKSDLQNLLKKQNNWAFPLSYFKKNKTSMGDFSVTDAELDGYLSNLTTELTTLNDSRTPSQNASLSFNEGTFAVVPEVVGNQLNVENIIKDIKTKIQAGEKTLELEDYLIAPTVTQNDETIQNQLAQANKVSAINGNYSINEQVINIPTETIQSWLTFTDGTLGLDQEKVKAYLSSLGEQYNTSSVPYTFNSSKRGQVSVPAGSYSWSIQVNSETEALTETILAGEDFTRVPITKGSSSANGPRIGNTYIEVDIQNQHMWYYKDGALVLETDVVTGKPTTPTPTGVFYVWNKESPSVLKGNNEDGTKYETPVNYWMPVDWTGVGIHDANWQPTFGGNWYLEHGSHGCVNTPPTVMKQLFEILETNTPVLIF